MSIFRVKGDKTQKCVRVVRFPGRSDRKADVRINQISPSRISNQNFTRDPELMLSKVGKLEVPLVCLVPPFCW